MPRLSCGLVMYRVYEGELQFLLVHPGGPFWSKKDLGAWTIPKGEPADGENLLDAARREFAEETGHMPAGDFRELAPVKQKGGKTIHAWAFTGELNVSAIRSNTFSMEWPPRSGKMAEFPEIDRAAFMNLELASRKINPAQVGLLVETARIIEGAG